MSRVARKSTASPSKPTRSPKKKSWRQCQQEYFCQRYPRLDAMEIIHRHAAGIDLGGKKSHFVALEIGQEIEVREFGMTTVQLWPDSSTYSTRGSLRWPLSRPGYTGSRSASCWNKRALKCTW